MGDANQLYKLQIFKKLTSFWYFDRCFMHNIERFHAR